MPHSGLDIEHGQTPVATAISRGVSSPAVSRAGLSTDKLPQHPVPEKGAVIDDSEDSLDSGSTKPVYDHTHRKLKPRHIQLIGIGGTIGTALYVQIGSTLIEGGPASLFIAFTLWLVALLAAILRLCRLSCASLVHPRWTRLYRSRCFQLLVGNANGIWVPSQKEKEVIKRILQGPISVARAQDTSTLLHTSFRSTLCPVSSGLPNLISLSF
ncbi:hypothetical protein BDV59DRAFT_104852 [Aspergillus ambiguus]|uniref:uncharacterized protein n=1 Tax=Aspergillus ambiguus TaxID=176160 RepID=UPI003CCD1A1B